MVYISDITSRPLIIEVIYVLDFVKQHEKFHQKTSGKRPYFTHFWCFYSGFFTNYYCFGQRDVDKYKKEAKHIYKYIPCGYIMSDYYKSKISSNPSIENDICLVSGWMNKPVYSSMFSPEHNKFIELKYAKVFMILDNLNQYLAKYLKNNSKNMVICARGDTDYEKQYYDKYYSGISRVEYIYRVYKNQFSSYEVIDKSYLIITVTSTLGLAAYSWGKKVLFCSIPDCEWYSYPEAGISFFCKEDYMSFQEKVNYIINMDDNEYKNITKTNSRYMNIYDEENSSCEIIRKDILAEIL